MHYKSDINVAAFSQGKSLKYPWEDERPGRRQNHNGSGGEKGDIPVFLPEFEQFFTAHKQTLWWTKRMRSVNARVTSSFDD
jgi:hypothetical protein